VDAEREIARMRAQGYSWHVIAANLNRRGVPTASGQGQWWPASCLRAVDRPQWNSYMRAYRQRHAR